MITTHHTHHAVFFADVSTPTFFFTNFFASRVDWWQRSEVKTFLDYVNRTGGVYFHRWGGVALRDSLGELCCLAVASVRIVSQPLTT